MGVGDLGFDGRTPQPTNRKRGPTRRGILKAGATLLAAGAAAPLLAAGGSAPAPSPRSNARGKTELTLMSWEIYQPTEYPAWQKVVQEFEAAHPNISVKWTGWPFSTYDQNVIEQAQSGLVQADVVQCPPELASTLIAVYNMCQPIGDIAQAAGLKPNAEHSQFTKNGKLYALGILEVAAALQYSKTVLEAGGASSPPSTMSEWVSMSKQITQPPKYYANALLNTVAAAADWWNPLQNFCLPYDGVWASGKNLTINSPENIKGIQLWLDLLNASGVSGSSEDTIGKLWAQDQVGMNLNVMLGGTATLKAQAPQLWPSLASAPPPWPSRKAISRLHPVVLLKSSKNQEAAQELVKWFVEPKNLWYVLQQNGYPVAPYSNFAEKVPEYEPYVQGLPWATGFNLTHFVGEYDILGDYVSRYAQIGNIICRNLENAITGGQSVSEALGAAQTEAKETLHVPSA
jgi:ABC-type glycerol-3-phosphate transport system substrate-binding protein